MLAGTDCQTGHWRLTMLWLCVESTAKCTRSRRHVWQCHVSHKVLASCAEGCKRICRMLYMSLSQPLTVAATTLQTNHQVTRTATAHTPRHKCHQQHALYHT
jgi:hypothetical protein